MDLEQLFEANLAPALLTATRLGGLFIFAPLLSSVMVPTQARVLLALMMTVAIFPHTPPPAPGVAELNLYSLGAAIAGEVFLGMTLGLLASMPLYAMQLAGMVTGQQMGLGLGVIYNPAIDAESDAVGQLLLFLAIGIYLSLGGMEAIFGALASSFDRIPAGAAPLSQPPLDLLIALTTSGFDLALRVSAPVLCILLIETAAMGFVMKTVPQLNILSVGFPIKILLGLAVLSLGVWHIGGAVRDEIMHAGGAALEWAGGPPRP